MSCQQQPCLQVYKARLGELEVAVKTIHRQYVNPHLSPQQAVQVIAKVTMFPFCYCQTPLNSSFNTVLHTTLCDLLNSALLVQL